jgi:hypothetical protein
MCFPLVFHFKFQARTEKKYFFFLPPGIQKASSTIVALGQMLRKGISQCLEENWKSWDLAHPEGSRKEREASWVFFYASVINR